MSLHPLVADGGPIDPIEAVTNEARPPHEERPWLFTNMVATLDGATAVDGLSGGLGDDDDRAMFRALRASADVILVASRTANVEGYRPPARSPETDRARADRHSLRPLIAVVTASLSVDPDLDLFADPDYRPLVITVPDAPADRRARLEEVATVITIAEAATGGVDLTAALRHLRTEGHRTVLSEGGPTLNAQLVAADLVDEWNMTLGFSLAAGDAARPAQGASSTDLRSFDLDRCWRGERALFGRWIRSAVDRERG